MKRALATVKAEETRTRIVDAALRLFRERGFNETTMREVATEAGVATGATYYYFRSKNDLVMAFYADTAEQMNAALPAILESTNDLKKRVHAIISYKLSQFVQHRRLLAALFRTAVDPADPLSPFGDETEELRADAIRLFAQAIEGSDRKIPKDLAPHLPQLLWMYQMGIILFWLFDRSPEQHKTQKLLGGTLDLIMKLLTVSSLPGMGGIRKSAVKILNEVTGDEETR